MHVAFSGILFPGKEEAAYSNFRLWEATGSVISYSSSPYFCTSTKLTAILVIMFVGMCGFGTIEYLDRKEKNGFETRNFELVENSNLDHHVTKL